MQGSILVLDAAKNIVGQLTLEQKAKLVSGDGPWHTADLSEFGLPPILMVDGPGGLRKQVDTSSTGDLFDSEPATCFPPAVALASSWDPGLVEEVGSAIGEEARRAGAAVVLGPGVNLKRSVRCGRNFEYYSEDPFLSGRMGAAWVFGIQSKGIGASLKHFAANNQETDRMRINVEVDMRTLQEMYLGAFRHVVQSEQPWSVMSAYNSLRGQFCSQNDWLLSNQLRDEWGFDGLVISDWGAVHDPVASIRAGLGLEMPGTGGRSAALLQEAVQTGRLAEADLDAAAVRVAQLVLRAQEAKADAKRSSAHLPGEQEGLVPRQVLENHSQLAIAAATQCAVLLENNGVLPLSKDLPAQDVAVIGRFADEPRYQGAGSSTINAWKVSSPLEAIRGVLGDVVYESGFTFEDEVDHDLEDRAVRAAARAKVALVFLGLPAAEESEGFDRKHIDLPDNQLELLDQIMGVNDNVVVVLANGGVVTVTPWAQDVGALLEGFLLGQGGGEAIAQILFGDANPSGHLAESIPHRLEDTCDYVNFPGEDNQVLYGERVFVGYRWYDELLLDVAYPFGYGLSYTQFQYSDLSVVAEDEALSVSFNLANTGPRDGAEVAQVYVSLPDSAMRRAPRELKAFAKVFLEAEEQTRVDLVVPLADLAYYNVERSQWNVEGGTYQVEVGGSSRDLPLRAEVDLKGDEPVRPLLMSDLLQDWMDHPLAGPVITEMVVAEGVDPSGTLMAFAKEMPVYKFAEFVPKQDAAALLEQLGDAVNQGVGPQELAKRFEVRL